MAADVVVYITSYCPFCTRVKALLAKKGVAFKEIDVSEDSARRAWLVQATGRKTVPQVFINDKSFGGFDDLAALDKAGKLDPLLQQPPAALEPASDWHPAGSGGPAPDRQRRSAAYEKQVSTAN